MRILFVGGGSGGHLTPLLAVAAIISKRHPRAELQLWTDDRTGSSELPHKRVLAGKWRRYQKNGKRYTPWRDRLRNLGDVFVFLAGFVQSLVRLIIWRPRVIFLKGGFVSLPVGLAAAALGIPFIIHESDTTMGLTNRVLSRFARKIATGLPTNQTSHKYVYTGIPVAAAWEQTRRMSDASARARLGSLSSLLKQLKQPLVVIVGGSLGARHLTNLARELKLPATLVVLAGPQAEEERVKDTIFLRNLGTGQGLPELLRLADVVVARAGATTLSELAILGKPVIIVPKDVLPGGHQTNNAARLAAAGAAIAIPEDEIDARLEAVILELLRDPERRRRLTRQLRSHSVLDADERLADLIEQVAEQKPNRARRA